MSIMFSIMMEKIGNPVTVCEPQSPTSQNTNLQMPSLDRMLNSVAGSAGDPPHPNRLKVNMNEDLSDVAKLKGKSIMQDKENNKCGATEDGSLGVGNVVAPMGDCSLRALGNGEGSDKTCGEGGKGESKVETLADGHVVEEESGEGNSGGSGSGVDRPLGNGDATLAPPLSSLKRVGLKPRRKNKQKSLTNVETSASQEAHAHD